MRRTVLPVIAAAALALGACASDGEEPDAAVTEPDESTITTASPEPGPTESEAPEPEPTTEEPSPSPETEGPPTEGEADLEGDFLEGTHESPGYGGAEQVGSDPSIYPVEVRVGSHEGFDRVVIEYESDSLPGWRAAFTDEATYAGSLDEIELDGEVILAVTTTGLDMGAGGPGPYDLTAGPQGVIAGVASGGVFEGYGTFYVGLDAERPYRITLLEEPTRVVIDIAND